MTENLQAALNYKTNHEQYSRMLLLLLGIQYENFEFYLDLVLRNLQNWKEVFIVPCICNMLLLFSFPNVYYNDVNSA